MAKNFITEQLKQEFKGRESFSREELFDFYRQFKPDLKETTFRWRIYQLKEEKIIRRLSRHEFSLAYKPPFKPEIDDIERKIYTKLEKQFPQLKQCIWSTKAVNEFMLHLPGKFITIMEAEKDALEPVFHYLKDINIRNVYLQPNEKELERYIYETETAVILQSLVSKAPTQKVEKVTTATIEKMLVDLYCDRKLFNAFQGSELVYIINNAYARYAIDFTKLFSYAKRRRKEIDLIQFLSDKTDIPKNLLND